jgi:hypothetical protein
MFVSVLDRVLQGADILGIRNLDREDVVGIVTGNQAIERERISHDGY